MTARVAALRGQDGLTLVEVLLTCTLMIVVLGATLTTLNSFERSVKANEQQNEAQDQTRAALDLMARDLRNLASPTPGLPHAIDVHEPDDVVFQSEGKEKPLGSLNPQNTTRVRYCVNHGESTLYRQIQTWTTAAPPAVPATASCDQGDAGWTRVQAVATAVVNGDRPVFTYNSTEPTAITEVTSELFVDVDPAREPTEVNLQTAVFLRNQNRAPTASFDWASMPNRNIFLNASESTDPEEKALVFKWFDVTARPGVDPDVDTPDGEGIVFTYRAPAPGPREMLLRVEDATLYTDSTQTVCASDPATGVTCPQ